KPGEARTLRNLGTIFALRCEFARAEAILRDAMKVAPADSDLAKALRDVRTNIATHLIGERKYDEAIVFFSDLVKSDPNDPNLRLGLADAYFKRAQSREGDARKQDFKAAGDAYSKGAELKPDDPDLPFNAALAYQSAGENEL